MAHRAPKWTAQSALKEAQRLLGPQALVKTGPAGRWPSGLCACCFDRACDGKAKAYEIGTPGLGGLFFMIRGAGHSWAAALADIARRDAR